MKGGGLRQLSYLLPISLLVVLTLITAGCSGPDDNIPADEPGYKVRFDEHGYKVRFDEHGNIISSPDPSYEVSVDDAGNRIITVKEGIGHFSMEYPSGFVLGSIKIDNSGGIESLYTDFIGPVTPDVGLPLIRINVDDFEGKYTAESAARNLLSSAQKYTNFKLLDESTVTVSGVTAYQHCYYHDKYPYDTHFEKPGEDAILVTRLIRAVYFDHSVLSWTIRMHSDPSREEHDMAVFDRILDSFRVLD